MNDQNTQPRTITAFNTAAASENRIHDDATARRFGFTGALVPGVEVYAYMCHLPVAAWGRDFLEHGMVECRFLKPVYDGERATMTAAPEHERLVLRVDSRGEQSAQGIAMRAHDEHAPDIAAYPAVAPAASRPPASFTALPEGGSLGIEPVTIDRAARNAYLADISEDLALFADGDLVHPGQILRLCNAALVQNVVLGPWIHVGSRVRNFAAARVGDTLTLRAKITSNIETKGHAIVTFDALAIANDATCIARIEHVAIWRPRQVSAAA